MTNARRTSLPAVAIFLVALLTVTTLLSLATGAFRISLSDLFGIIGDGPSRDTSEVVAHNVFWQVRLPRIVLAIIVGASLAVAGVIMQGIFRNPLAEPATVGVSAGAAVGAVIAIIVGLNQLPLGVQLAAFLGGTLSTALVYVLSRSDGKTEVVTLILTGIAINAFAGAVIGFAVFVADDDEIRSVTFWSLGTLGLATWKAVGLVIPLALLGMAMSAKFARVLDTLALGDRPATHLGVRVEPVRLQAIAVVGLLASSAVAATGMIAFVGLLVPHIMRIVLGPRHRHLLWTAALLGASVTLLADLAARSLLSPAELPLGVVTALIGAPFFLLLLRSTRRSQGGWA
ncbi:MAG: FecCD family ABC transporter permease [Ilumatobacteraceae bacterium]|jgi:iron complex transport system permease protein|nr:ABC transporter permease [Actinomycetes bacterium]